MTPVAQVWFRETIGKPGGTGEEKFGKKEVDTGRFSLYFNFAEAKNWENDA